MSLGWEFGKMIPENDFRMGFLRKMIFGWEFTNGK